MEDLSLIRRVKTVFAEYTEVLGPENLNLSDDLSIAQQELKAIEKKQGQVETFLTSIDVQMLGRESRLEAYTQFIQSEQAKKDKQNKDLTDLISVDPTTEIDTSNKVKSRLEILAEERDYKRRRQSYKGGKSGSSKRSYTEVIRDVIETQSEMLRSMNAGDKLKIKQEPSLTDR